MLRKLTSAKNGFGEQHDPEVAELAENQELGERGKVFFRENPISPERINFRLKTRRQVVRAASLPRCRG
jgi:hypothetical protein